MNENILSIEPHKGLGFLKLESSINYIITEIKSRSDKLDHADFIISESSTVSEPIYIYLAKEGIKLRFDWLYQKLELIEIDAKVVKERVYSIYYKNTQIIGHNSNHITYNYINSAFGPSNIPKLIDSNKYLLLRYEGVSFLFDNFGVESEDSIILGTDAALTKVIIFQDNTLIDSINRESNNFKQPVPIVKIDVDKYSFTLIIDSNINTETDCDVTVSIGETVESVLYKLKNPNFIFYKQSESEYDSISYDNDTITSDNEDSDYFLNYYSYGLDVMIDACTSKVVKFIFHTNSVLDVKFGIYNRCNFYLDISKHFFRKVNETNNYDSVHMQLYGSSSRSRKVSEDSSSRYHTEEKEKDLNNGILEDKMGLKIDKVESITLQTQNLIIDNNLSYKDSYIATSNKKIHKTSFENEKSFTSINESNLSISLNNSDIFVGVSVTATTNFLEILNKIPINSYIVYHKHESKMNSLIKYYVFDGLIFEVLENYSIASVTVFKGNK